MKTLIVVLILVMAGCEQKEGTVTTLVTQTKCADDSTLLGLGQNTGRAKWLREVEAASQPQEVKPAAPQRPKYPHRFVVDSLLGAEPLKSLWPRTGYVEIKDGGMDYHDVMWIEDTEPFAYNTLTINDKREYSPDELRCMLIEQFGIIIGYREARAGK